MSTVRYFQLPVQVFLLTAMAGFVTEVPAQLGDLGISLSPKAPPLSAAEVKAILEGAAASLDEPMTVAVVDRVGKVLGVFQKPGAPDLVPGNFSQETTFFTGEEEDALEVAVALARTAAFFSNNQAPLSSRTVRFISGIHFPPGIRFTPNAALYGIENTNRGCELNVTFNSGKEVPPAKSLNGGSCNADDQSGCGLGVLTGKPDLFDSDSKTVNPGGVPIFRGAVLVGGIGVAGDLPGDQAEFAAFIGAASSGLSPAPALPLPPRKLVVFLDGIRLPFVDNRTLFKGKLPRGTMPGSAEGGVFVVDPTEGSCYSEGFDQNGDRVCLPAPEGYLVGPLDGLKLTAEEVEQIVRNALKTANRARAAIRLPTGSRTKMVIAVGDVDGTILALFRMPDSTVFSIDVAVAKARNVAFFSSLDPDASLDLDGVPVGTAVTNRTIGFGSQPLYPPGIDGTEPGPFFDLFVHDTKNACSQGSQTPNTNQSGVVFFPGSTPLYKGGELVGGLGVSGDGVEQDDVVTNGGAKKLLARKKMRANKVRIRRVRLPFFKFTRNPFR